MFVWNILLLLLFVIKNQAMWFTLQTHEYIKCYCSAVVVFQCPFSCFPCTFSSEHMRPLSCRWAIGGGLQVAVGDPDSCWRQRHCPLPPSNSPLCPTALGRGAWRTPKLLSYSSRRIQKSFSQICVRSDMAVLVLFISWVFSSLMWWCEPKAAFSVLLKHKHNKG